MESYGKGLVENKKDIIIHHDSTAFGGAKEGFILTEYGIAYKDLFCEPAIVFFNETTELGIQEKDNEYSESWNISLNGNEPAQFLFTKENGKNDISYTTELTAEIVVEKRITTNDIRARIMPIPKVILESLLQFEKAYSPIVFRLSLISISVRSLQSANAYSFIEVILSGKLISDIEVFLNA